jgi:hypothetical protein
VRVEEEAHLWLARAQLLFEFGPGWDSVRHCLLLE